MQIRIRLLVVGCVLLGGCAGVSPTRIVGDSVGAVGGALLGNAFGKGDVLTTSLGAGAGVLLSESLQAGSSVTQNKAYLSGYEQGRSDSAKTQYQTLNERQRLAPQADDAGHLRLFDVPLPERQVNGVTFAPATATLRIQE